MSDVDRERLAVPQAHSVFSQHTNTGSYSGTSITGTSAAPPFAPRPHYGQQIRQQHQQRLHSTAASSRSGGTSHTDRAPPSAVSGTSSASTQECSINEVCYYFQQAIFILAIMTGVALVIAGAVMHVQNGELLVLVYIGVLLGAVNTVLLTIQCCVRRKQKKRSRAYRASRPSQGPPSSAPSSAVVRYDPLSNPLLSSSATQTVPAGDVQQYHYKHYHIHPPNVTQTSFQDYPVQQDIFAQSPTESSQTRMHHGVPYHRSGSIAGHHRHAKALYQKSPPLGQVHRPLLNPLGPQQTNIRSDLLPPEQYKLPTAPPPHFDDLLRTGRLTQDGTMVHLI